MWQLNAILYKNSYFSGSSSKIKFRENMFYKIDKYLDNNGFKTMEFNFHPKRGLVFSKLCISYRNYLFLGTCSTKSYSLNKLLVGFRLTSIEILKKRFIYSIGQYYILKMASKEYYSCNEVFHPFKSFVKKMRWYFDLNDIVKMWQLDGTLYNKEEVQYVYEHRPEIAKQYYQTYINNNSKPSDILTFGPLFDLELNEKHINNLIGCGFSFSEFDIIIKMYKKDIIELRNESFDNFDDEYIMDIIKKIRDKGIKVISDDQRINEIIEKVGMRVKIR